MSAALFTHPDREKVSRWLGRALKRRKELDRRVSHCELHGDPVPVAYVKLIRDAKEVIAHEQQGQPGHRHVIDGKTAGQLLGLTKDVRRRLGIVTMKAIDETDEERAEYVAERRRERQREAARLKRARAKAAKPRKITAAERAKALGISLRTYYNRLRRAREAAALADCTLFVGARTYVPTPRPATENAATAPAAAPQPAPVRAGPALTPAPSSAGRAKEPEAASVVIPFMITAAMKARLRAIGFTDEDIRHMTPAEAHAALGAGARDGSGAEPRRSEAGPPIAPAAASSATAGERRTRADSSRAPEPIEIVAERRLAWRHHCPKGIRFDRDRWRDDGEALRAARFLFGAPPRREIVSQLGRLERVAEARDVTAMLLKARDDAAAIVAAVMAAPDTGP